MRKVILAVAPIAYHSAVTVKDVIDDIVACNKAGATFLHLHPVKLNGTFDPEGETFNKIVSGVRENGDMVVQASTGIPGLGRDDRYRILNRPDVRSCTFGGGSVTLGDDDTLINTLNELRYLRDLINQKGIRAEFQIWETGMLHTMKILHDENPFIANPTYNLVFGMKYAQPSDMRYLYAARSLLPEGALFGVTDQERRDFSLIMAGVLLGARLIRVGMEDSDYISPTERAKTNLELVQYAAKIIRMCGCKVATVQETRRLMRI